VTYTRTPTATATYTRTPTATATYTPTRTPTATVTGSATSTPPWGGGTGTPWIITATQTFTPVVFSPTPDWVATITALAGGAAVVSPTPDWGATITALAGTPAATATPNFNATLKAVDAVSTQSPSPLSGGGGGSGSGSGAAGSVTPGAPGWAVSGQGGSCYAWVRVVVFVDNNKDNLMAISGEGVQGVMVYLRNADFQVVRQGQTENGVVKFCMPQSLAGQQVYVDVPYLLRSGSVQIPRANNSGGIGGVSLFGGVALQNQVTTVTTLESIFRLDPPQLPLYIP
jgi:hypothetical protein